MIGNRNKIDLVQNRRGPFRLLPFGLYEMVFDRRPQPSAGAGVYSWETLALVPHNIIAQGISARSQMNVVEPQVYHMQTAWLDGIPTTSGQFILQPAYDL